LQTIVRGWHLESVQAPAEARDPLSERSDTSSAFGSARRYWDYNVVGIKGFYPVKNQIEADAMIAAFHQYYPLDKFPKFTAKEYSVVLPIVKGRVAQCSVMTPKHALMLINDTPLFGPINVWSQWKYILEGGGVLGISILLTNLGVAPHILHPISMILRLCVFVTFLWSHSRGRLWRILKTFDALIILFYLLTFMSFALYLDYATYEDPIAKYFIMAAQILFTIPLFLCIVGVDAVQEHDRKKKLVVTVLCAIFMAWYFVQFRFLVDSFTEKQQDVLNQTIEIGLLVADISVIIAQAAMNICIFLVKYVVNLWMGREFIILTFPWESRVLHDAVDPLAFGGDPTITHVRLHGVGISGFQPVKSGIEADAMIAQFRQRYPLDKFPKYSIEGSSLPNAEGRISKCVVLTPVEAVKLINDNPLIGDFDVFSTWFRFLCTLGVLGTSILLTNIGVAPHILVRAKTKNNASSIA